MIGSDIIDLKQAVFSSNTRLLRYWNKITTSQEQRNYKPSDAILWQLWGLKECVYKAESRRIGAHVFSPTNINCTRLNNHEAIAQCGNQRYLATVKKEDSKVVVNALNSALNWTNFRIFRSSLPKTKTALLTEFSSETNQNLKELTIYKTAGIPWIVNIKSNAKYAVSYSHHGQFFSAVYSVLPTSESSLQNWLPQQRRSGLYA